MSIFAPDLIGSATRLSWAIASWRVVVIEHNLEVRRWSASGMSHDAVAFNRDEIRACGGQIHQTGDHRRVRLGPELTQFFGHDVTRVVTLPPGLLIPEHDGRHQRIARRGFRTCRGNADKRIIADRNETAEVLIQEEGHRRRSTRRPAHGPEEMSRPDDRGSHNSRVHGRGHLDLESTPDGRIGRHVGAPLTAKGRGDWDDMATSS